MKVEERAKKILDELDSLNHYGVLGMKWGRRKKITISEARRNAKTAGRKAADDTYNKAKKEGSNKLGSFRKANNDAKKAYNVAYKNSIKSDKAKNKAKSEIKKMSDTELRQKINRLQMEKQYSQLTQREKSSGEKFVQDVLTGAAKQTASSYVSKYMTKGIDELLKKSKK